MIKHDFNPTQPYTFVRYGRMSLDSQNPRSPDQQFQVIEEMIVKLAFPWRNLRDYRDDGVTGKFLRRRPGFSAMLANIRSSPVKPDLILLDTSERLGRAEELAEIRRQLRVRHGVLILTADSRFADPTTPAGHVMETFENLRATEENRIKAHQVRRGKVDAIRLKHWPGGPTPFGYKLKSVLIERHGRQEVDYCLLIPDPETSWLIVKVFRLAAETGYGPLKLSELLNKDETIPKEYRRLMPSTIGRWLDNSIYVGTLVWGQNAADIVEDIRVLQPSKEEDIVVQPEFCEAVIDQATWDAVRSIREIRREKARLSKEKTKDGADQKLIRPLVPGLALVYPLGGLLVCAECKRTMIISSSGKFKMKSGEEKRYAPVYFCPGAQAGACNNHRRVQEPWLFAEILKRLNARFVGFDFAKEAK